MDNLDSLVDGWYILRNSDEPNDSLVKLYSIKDYDTGIEKRGFGFGIWDGAGFLPLNDIKESTEIIHVQIVPKSCLFNLTFKSL